jgi:sRNA-binding regulator protein Hfq
MGAVFAPILPGLGGPPMKPGRRPPPAELPEKAREAARERARDLVAKGVPAAMAAAVAQGRMSLEDALGRLAQRAEVERMMRKHDLSRAVATQVVLGHADLAAFLARRRMEQHVEQNQQRSCLEDTKAAGAALSIQLTGGERVEGKVVTVEPYEVVVQAADGERRLHKLTLKAAWSPDDYKKVRKIIRRDKELGEHPLPVPVRPQDRYGLSDKRLFRYLDAALLVDFTLVEGEIFRGQVAWFSRYEIGLTLKGGGALTLFRHALHDVREAR